MFKQLKIQLGVLAMALGVAFAAPAVASDEDARAGLRDTLELCATCHGETGATPLQADYPILAGQHLYYLYVQLKDFKSGLRANEIMAPIAAELEKDDMLALAEYFSKQSWPNIGHVADPDRARQGEIATGAGQCVQCHRGGYEGDSRVPRLAGQNPAYLDKTMADFKSKARNNSPAKSSLMGSFSLDDVAAMAEYLAGM